MIHLFYFLFVEQQKQLDLKETDKKREKILEEKKGPIQIQPQNGKPEGSSKYHNYTPDEKRTFIIQSQLPNQTPESIAKLKGIGPTNIRRWSKQLDNNVEDFGKDMRSKKSGRKVKHLQLDDHIKAWFSKLRGAKVAVSGVMVFAEAQIYVNLHNLQDIKLSRGWQHKLLKRLNIVKRKATKIAQKSSILFEPQIKNFISLMTEHR